MIAGSGTPLLTDKELSAATEIHELTGNPLDPDHEYVLSNTGGTAVWQYHDGSGWVDYPKSASGEASIIATPPPNGRVRLNVTAGTATANAFRRAWRS